MLCLKAIDEADFKCRASDMRVFLTVADTCMFIYAAEVPALVEYVNGWISANLVDFTKLTEFLICSSVSPGNPTMTSAVIEASGIR